MSQSTTTAGSQASQEDTMNQGLWLIGQNYNPDPECPDRQEYVLSSQESIAPCSLGVPLTQVSEPSPSSATPNASLYDPMLLFARPLSTQSVSATPTPPDGHERLRSAITRMNADMEKHGYIAFVRGNTHIMFKTYHGIDLERE